MKSIGVSFLCLTATAILTYLFIVASGPAQTKPADSPASNEKPQAANNSLGKAVYEEKCSRCHGLSGKGDGPAASLLNPRPRNFESGKYKFRTTESGSIPTDDDLIETVKNGLHGTAMPDWGAFLTGDSLRATLEYVKAFSPRFANEKPKAVTIGPPQPISWQSIAKGRKTYETLQCAKCHGDDGQGTNAVATELKDDEGHDIKATNLTEPWTFRGGATVRDVYLRVLSGIDGSPMPSYASAATSKEIWDLANFVLSLSRKPVWGMTEQDVKRFYASKEAEAANNPVLRGKYLVETMGCEDCHTPVRSDGGLIEELSLAGGQRWSLGPYGSLITPNLTSDKATGLGDWTDEDIKNVLTKGIRKDGTRMLPFPMSWPDYGHMTDADMKALISYLRTVPPISNKIPPREPLNFFSYLVEKFKMLMLKQPIVAGIEPGNAGSAGVQSQTTEK